MTTAKEIKDLLDEYTSLTLELDAVEAQKQALIDGVLTPEVKGALDDIEVEFEPEIMGLSNKKDVVADKIKYAVKFHRETVRNDLFMAVYSKPRVKWNTKMLEGYALDHPEIKMAMSTGEPSVTIRLIPDKKKVVW